jgi:hypothetical protein
LKRHDFLLNTGGAPGTMVINVPNGIEYITILNTSGYTFNIFEGASVDQVNFMCSISPNDYRCLPITIKNQLGINAILIQWTGAATTDSIRGMFTDEFLSIGSGPIGGVTTANQGVPNVIGNAWPTYLRQGVAALSIANPLFSEISLAGAAVAAANPLFVELSDGAAAVGVIGNPLFCNLVPVGAQANAWNAVAVLAGGVSNNIDCQFNQRISAFGVVDAATTIDLMVSQDNVNFYVAGNQVLGGAGDFHITVESGARYAHLRSVGAATITGTIAAK